MHRGDLNDLLAFLAVARERSFTKAAAKLGVSQSALSHTIRELEVRLGVRLLNRTTRAVSPTEAGERLLDGIGPHFDEIEAQVDALSELREKPAGTIRITASDHAINHILWPKLRKFLPNYPDIKVELVLENEFTDIVTKRFDAGVRMGEHLAKDMISARIGPDIRYAVVGSESYFKNNGEPSRPQDLLSHNCINLRLPTYGGIWAWEFEEKGREIKVRVDGQVVFNYIYNVLEAAMDGLGLAYVSDDHAGLRQAIVEVLPEAAWQRCYVHFLRNALDYVPRKVDDARLAPSADAVSARSGAPARAALALRPARPRGGQA